MKNGLQRPELGRKAASIRNGTSTRKASLAPTRKVARAGKATRKAARTR